MARVYLAEFIRLGTQEVPRGRDGMARWIAHLDALVTTVEANPPVAEAFLKLLQQALTSRRSTLVQMEDLSPERFVAHLGPRGPLPSVRQQAAPASGQPQPAPTAGQSLWQRVVSTFVEFVKNTAFGVATAGTALQAADPEVARAALSSVARRDALQQCYDNFEACRAGQLPAYNRLAAGDVEGAFVLAHPQAVVTPTPPPAAAAPPSSSGSAPQAAGGQAPAASTGQTGSFTATPAPPPSAQESSAGPPAPSPAPPPAPPPEPPAAMVAVNMTGRWVGSYHEDLTMTVDGKSCSTSYGGRVTHVLVHSGTTLSGSAVFEGGAPELDPDTCIIKSRDDWEETLNNAPVGEVVVGRRFVIRTSDDAAGWSQTTTITLLSPNTAEVTYSGGTPFSRWSGTINIRRER